MAKNSGPRSLQQRIDRPGTHTVVVAKEEARALLDVAEAASTMDYAWERLDECIEAGFAAEERPDIARARVIRAARGLRVALAILKRE